MRIQPRQEQRSVTKQVFSLLQNEPSVLVIAPTGYGKTVVMGDVAQEEISRGGRVLAVVNLQVLLGQTVATMQHGFGIEASALHEKITSYLFNGETLPLVCDFDRNFKITLPVTLTSTISGSNKLSWDDSFVPTMILFDEAHKATAAEFQRIRKMFPKAKIVGFTATPHREKNESGESLQEWYGDRWIVAASMSDLIADGRLAKPIYKVVGEAHIAKTWLAATAGHDNKRTIVFTDDTDHSKMLEAQFLDAGIRCEVVTSGKGVIGDKDYVAPQMPKDRDAIFARYHRGETEVLISVNALCEGFDEKLAKFCFLTRRVANIALYQQMCGRVLRQCDGKPEGFIYDFAGNFKEHGPVEAIEWPRAAKGLVLDQEEREICGKSFAKRENVWKRCAGHDCGHVYNIKLSKSCKVCGTAHNVQISSMVADLVTAHLGMNHKQFEVMAPKIRMALNNPSLHAMINKQTSLPIFQNGELNGAFDVLPELIAVYESEKKRVGGKYVGNWEGKVLMAA